jgi:hypothetical protein
MTREKTRKILINEAELLGVRCIGRPIGVKCGTAVCYLRGTRIRTPEGERRIEELKIGDQVVTVSGESKPIKWIGHQRFKKSSECWPKDFEPIRIRPFALDERTPHRDLYLSPNHAVYIDGMLIPAKYLVNGRSITQCAPEGAEVIEYLHIELFTHDVIFAEGAAAESLLVTSEHETFADLTHDKFDNFVEHERLYTAKGIPPMTPYAPRVCYNGRRSELKALLRRAMSPVVDIRDPIQLLHDRIAARAIEIKTPRASAASR